MSSAVQLPSAELDDSTFEVIHPDSIRDEREIRALLERVRDERIPLRRGMNRMIEPEEAFLEEIGAEGLTLRGRNFAATGRTQLFLTAMVDERPHFFSANLASGETEDQLRTDLPRVVWKVERRDRRRDVLGQGADGWLTLRPSKLENAALVKAQLADRSAGGLGVWLEQTDHVGLGVRVDLLDVDERTAPRQQATVRSLRPDPERPGWVRVGLAFDSGPTAAASIAIEERKAIAPLSSLGRLSQTIGTGLGAARVAVGSKLKRALGRRERETNVPLFSFRTAAGEEIKAIIDSTGDPLGAPAIVIPPAWGRTKETLGALASTLLETFERAGQSLVVVRFDGVRKRGESHNDPECRETGKEHLHFTFTQGVRDLEAALDFLDTDPRFRPSKKVLVSFSASAIETRALLARQEPGRIAGWVCVVGAPDLQSMMRTISGGVDYILGSERGGRFGLQEVLGVVVDIDFAAQDAIAEGLAFLEDGRRDMERIGGPIAWIRGTHDGWMDRERVIELLASGDASNRRLIEVPSGHQIKSSREALEIFQLITSEASNMLLGEALKPVAPDVGELTRRQRAERARLPRNETDLPGFWRNYLLGRDGRLGIDLLNETTTYREMMDRQLELLALREGDRVLDLGCGTGAFARGLRRASSPKLGALVGLDLVNDALPQWRAEAEKLAPEFVDTRCADLSNLQRGELPFEDASFDAIIASLLFGYVEDPAALARELQRVMKPGGRLVLSALRPDADLSLIYADGLAEIDRGDLTPSFDRSAAELRKSANAVLNEASRIVDLEEQGTFAFPDLDAYQRLLADAGFSDLQHERSLGHPPQALVLRAKRR